jgi:hypothetical protein
MAAVQSPSYYDSNFLKKKWKYLCIQCCRFQGSNILWNVPRFRPFFFLVRSINQNVIYIQSVPRSKHSVSVIKTTQLMLYREIIAVCSQIHTKHINTLCGQNVELLDIKLVVHVVTTGF